MAQPQEPLIVSKEIAAKAIESDREARRFFKLAVALFIAFVIGALTYLVVHTIQNEHETQKVLQETATIIEKQGEELKVIQDNQKNNSNAFGQQLTDIQALLSQQDLYIKCIAQTYPHSENCPAPTYTSPYSGSSQTPVKSSQNSPQSNNTAGNSHTTPPVTVPQPKKNLIQQVLSLFGL